ncbi:hypothetical protein [Caulobacter phage Cr30]|nr:hypothetical protein OZ74_gp067 [Caulobacter phage Cr30]AGS80952.1 hypothetical protein [Caulobacter phage Cr30]
MTLYGWILALAFALALPLTIIDQYGYASTVFIFGVIASMVSYKMENK